MLIDELGNGFKRHGFNQCHDHGFKQQRETAAGSSPWNVNQPYHIPQLSHLIPGTLAVR